ncbi:cation:proton antiporter [Pararhizobium sp. YC-54]|uniref:cation:proton antiporter n=1 Tax=Pararhizobium sp. YC-54 TaxID=2986920 RepID=UPI0021F6B933|nr:cation:proton antiporter [Pararhizobium sp. YC-54]MCV9997773.1 cation:proton antiporter [Pararhizobium sp. YC-54]
MSAAEILSYSIHFAAAALSLGLLLTVLRILRGPALPDRLLGLDMLVAIAIGFIAVIAIKSGFNLYIDIAIALSLVGFLATVAFARFILARGLSPETEKGRETMPKPRHGKPARRKHKGAR